MLNRKRILAIILFIFAGLIVFTFANPGDDGTKEPTNEQTEVDQDLIDATKAVEKAEESKTQVDVDAARLLVDALPAGDERDDLSDRLDAIDTIAPVITVVGANPATVALGGIYLDAGATATDNKDGNLTGSIVRNGTVNTAVVGSYTITYRVSDAAGHSDTATRIVNVVDLTAPVITLIGTTPITIEVGSVYTDLGATASDNIDGNITGRIIRTGVVNTSLIGTYTITYTVFDIAGNSATLNRIVNVVDTTIPVITLNGNASYKVVLSKNTYTDTGAVLSDNYDLDKTIYGFVNGSTTTVGTYTLEYNGADLAGNKADEVIRSIKVLSVNGDEDGDGYTNGEEVDAGTDYDDPNSKPTYSAAPVITMNGVTPFEMNVCYLPGCKYQDLGATAIDNIDGDMTSEIEITKNVNEKKIGKYTVIYTVTDSNGNVATATREVIVKPIIKFAPTHDNDYEKNHYVGITVLPGLTGYNMLNSNSLKYLWTTSTTQPLETDFTNNFSVIDLIKTPNNLNGTYYLWILVKDIQGNITIKRTDGFNLDNIAPTIVLKGDNPMTIVKGTAYVEPGAIVSDNFDTNPDLGITGQVKTNIIGTYKVTYKATDDAGNVTIVKRTVNVVNVADTTKPTITLLGNSVIDINFGSTYTDEGATVTDNYDETRTIYGTVTSGSTTAVGTYTLTYTAADAVGNAATTITRTVNINAVNTDTTAPKMTVVLFKNGNPTNTDNVDSVKITISDVSGIDASSLKWGIFTDYDGFVTPTSTEVINQNHSFSLTEGIFTLGKTTMDDYMTGTGQVRYRLCVYATDMNANGAVVCSSPFKK